MATNNVIETEVSGYRGALLILALKTAFLTLITLGIYSVWARTRLRRWLWSAVRPGGVPLEYTGQPLEKLLGFFVAAVIVTLYVGLGVMVFTYYGLKWTGDIQVGAVLALIVILPLYFIAQYRGKRYLVGHTSWRGIQFWMAQGSIGYMFRAILWSTIAVLTLGLAWPIGRFRLEKYVIDRTYYGSKKFQLLGSNFLLYKAAALYLVTIIAYIAVIIALFRTGDLLFFSLMFIMLPVLAISYAHYRVSSFRLIYSSIVFDGISEIDIYPRTGRVIFINILGGMIVWLIASLSLPVVGFMAAAIFLNTAIGDVDWTKLDEVVDQIQPEILFLTGYLAFIVLFLARSQLRLVFVNFPVLKHALDTLVIYESQAVPSTQQVSRKQMADADGLAAIFDIGGGV